MPHDSTAARYARLFLALAAIIFALGCGLQKLVSQNTEYRHHFLQRGIGSFCLLLTNPRGSFNKLQGGQKPSKGQIWPLPRQLAFLSFVLRQSKSFLEKLHTHHSRLYISFTFETNTLPPRHQPSLTKLSIDAHHHFLPMTHFLRGLHQPLFLLSFTKRQGLRQHLQNGIYSIA